MKRKIASLVSATCLCGLLDDLVLAEGDLAS